MTSSAPIAKRVPSSRTFHGDTFVDEYAWLAAKLEDPDGVAYLKAENEFTDEATAHLATLQETLFTETRQRNLETDLSLPVRNGKYWYYTRTVEGLEYGIHCRVAALTDTPPVTEAGKSLDGEEVLLDANALAGDRGFLELGVFDVSPDGDWLAYSVDFDGDERYTVHFKDLRSGTVLEEQIPGTGYSAAWSLDASVYFYTTMDDAWRSDKVVRHVMGTPVADDVVVLYEPDQRYGVGVTLSRSEQVLFMYAASKITAEVNYLSSAHPFDDLRLVAARREGVEYHVDHQGDRFLILHNDNAEDFALATTPMDQPGEWTPLIEHQPGLRLTDMDAFADHVIVSIRQDGLTGLRVLPTDGEPFDISLPEPLYSVSMDANEEFVTSTIRIGYQSMVTPSSIYECDLGTGALTLLKRRPVLPDAKGREYDPDDYEQFRSWALAPDGAKVPLSIVVRRGTPRDGSAPFLMFGYGSYEASMDPYFSIPRLSLMDRGVGFAIAHVRGGGEMGRGWYDHGKLLEKKNTFTDFIACAEHLVAEGWTSVPKLVGRGGSAGGLLIGAVANMAPTAFGGLVAEVPFVDALTTILDPALPLTVVEWDEWGNPIEDPDVYAYMKSYTPYENVADLPYPPMLVVTSLNDTRVLYTEAAKWVAQLRVSAPQAQVLLRTDMGAGHAGPSGRYNIWREEAFVLSWVLDRAGITA